MSWARIRAAGAPLRGRLSLPGDKSLSHRRALLTLFASEPVELRNFGTGADCRSTLDCLKRLGKSVKQSGTTVVISGTSECRSAELDCGNSGTTARLLMGLLAGREGEWVLHGDTSLSRRPMERVAEPLRLMGADLELTDGHLPARIRGRKLRGIAYDSPVASAQVKSAVLLAGLSAEGITRYREAIPTRDHTERLLRLPETADSWITLDPTRDLISNEELSGEIPGDPSTASFWMAAALLVPDSEISMDGVLANPRRLGLVRLLQKAGADITARPEPVPGREAVATVTVRHSRVSAVHVCQPLTAELIDELPALSVTATTFDGISSVRDAVELKVKESDRLSLLIRGLRDMGAPVTPHEDGLDVAGPSRLHGAEIETEADHRIAMAFAVAGLAAEGETVIHAAECVSISYPAFWNELSRLAPGAVSAGV